MLNSTTFRILTPATSHHPAVIAGLVGSYFYKILSDWRQGRGVRYSGAIVVVGINGFLSKYITGHSIDQAASDSSIKHYILIHGLPLSLSLSLSSSASELVMFDVWDIIAVLISVSPLCSLSKVRSNKQIIG